MGNRNLNRRQIVASLVLSPLYFDLKPRQRLRLIESLLPLVRKPALRPRRRGLPRRV